MSKPKVSITEYLQAVEEFLGWCDVCEKFTRSTTEPDAAGYNCPECETPSVYGAEFAMLAGKFEICK